MSDAKSLQKQEAQHLEKSERTRSGKVFIPATDIIETDSSIVMLVDMPGVDEKNIDVTLEDNELTIQGNVDAKGPEGYELLWSEYQMGDYYRSFSLSDVVDRDKIEATYKNGLLKLTLPKAEKMKPKQISVKTE